MKWQSFRNALVQIHLWVALILCVPMIIIGLSGSALLLQREILLMSVPQAGAAGERQPISKVIAAAQAAAPKAMVVNRIDLPSGEGGAASVRFKPREGEGPSVDYYVDPASLKILGSSEVVERGPVLAFFITIHAFLAMPPPIGLPFVGYNGVVMTFMGLTGLVLWWPRKGQWGSAFWVRRGARGQAFYFDLHRAAGIWGVLVLVAVSLSGIYLTFPQTLGPILRAHLPGGESATEPLPGHLKLTGPLIPEQAAALAASAVSNTRVAGMELPGEEKSFVVDLEPQGLAPSEPHVLVVLDSETAEITYIDDPRNYTFGETVLNWQHLIHFGVGLGLIWKVLVFLSGLLPLLFAVTGLTVWWKKRQARIRNVPAEAGVVQPVSSSS